MDERACNGDTLHLATGELVGMTIAEALEFHPGKPFPGRFARVVARSSGSSTFSKTVNVCSN